MVRIVLVAPEIPANTGNIARTCAATGSPLYLVDPLGFQLSDRYLKRAGLDYWDAVEMHRYPSWQALLQEHPQGRFWGLTVRGKSLYTQVTYQPEDWLVFGSETQGLPPDLLAQIPTLRIPMQGSVRSLNLSNAVAIVLFEALRQLSMG
ncbi:MAG: tRNA (uridine(34)/cytosine(34)/5-carboxymethylaminomethyluridine(34)-2'-O)-methyltransferase TrmL [Cyanobacteriota bacterium]|nr:tRNA (uridine(34)/cytosine(34)/5-carboxymethylaminomethyluridine(34)-2'-O)-methyltransferase TrmL [Cyanobacteriota bacterium]